MCAYKRRCQPWTSASPIQAGQRFSEIRMMPEMDSFVGQMFQYALGGCVRRSPGSRSRGGGRFPISGHRPRPAASCRPSHGLCGLSVPKILLSSPKSPSKKRTPEGVRLGRTNYLALSSRSRHLWGSQAYTTYITTVLQPENPRLCCCPEPHLSRRLKHLISGRCLCRPVRRARRCCR